MNTLFLTSRIDYYNTNADGSLSPKQIANTNNLIDNLKQYIKRFNNMLCIASDPNNHEYNEMKSKILFKSFDLTLPFAEYNVLDSRNLHKSKSLIRKANLIILMGGHVPTQNRFFEQINLAELLETNNNKVIIGISAGSMNSASAVYCPPEIDGETFNGNFHRILKGLRLTEYNIIPHHKDTKKLEVDGINVYNNYILPDSHNINLFALEDGSYILQTTRSVQLFGEAYLIRNGKATLICKNNQVQEI